MNPKVLPADRGAVCSGDDFFGAVRILPPGKTPGFSERSPDLAVGIPLAAAGVDSRIAIPAALGAAALAAGVSYVIAKHQATERQRQICRAARATLHGATSCRSSSGRRERQPWPPGSGTKKAKAPKETRYIAVKTQNESFNKGQSAVMIYDTQSNQIVGNNVYDLKSTPKVGQTSKFDTYTAEYVGTGS